MKQPARTPQGKKPAARVKRKSREELNQEARDRKRDKKHRGNASGSRANSGSTTSQGTAGRQQQDPRIGSKKPIALGADAAQSVKPAQTKPAVKKKAVAVDPADELTALENDPRLDGLLDRLENGDTLSAEDQAWLDQTLDRIDVLMEQLGIDINEGNDEEDQEAEEDMYRLLKGSH